MIPKTFKGNDINDGTNYDAYMMAPAYGLPKVDPSLVARSGNWPVISTIGRPGQQVYLEIIIRGSNTTTLRRQLLRWFDPEDETPGQLVVEEEDGSLDRYLMCLCKSFEEAPNTAGLVFSVTLQVDEDVRKRLTTAVTDAWNITATGQTRVINNTGEDEAYPIFTIEPTTAKSTGFAWKRWIPIRWTADVGAQMHPLDLTAGGFDTAALITAGKMQADGDDLRIYVNGLDVDRWLSAINTTTTKIWSNLSFSAKQEVTLETAIAGPGAITTIDVNEDISGFPAAGILVIGSEALTYTNKNNQLKRFTGVTRAQKGTSAAAHAVGDTAWWVQNDVWMHYGDSSLGSLFVPDPNKFQPIFDLTASSNTFWDYQNFGQSGVARPGAWSRYVTNGAETYVGDEGGTATPFEELGIRVTGTIEGAVGGWSLFNPFGISSANFLNGEKRINSTALNNFRAYLRSSADSSSWFTEYTIPVPAVSSTWEIWARNETFNTGARYIVLELNEKGGAESFVECSRVIVTVTAAPTITINAEQSNYQLDCTLTNTTTGKAIILSFNMQINEGLEADTDEKTITYLKDGSSQFQALGLVGGPRRAWLPLARGNNTLQFDDAGTVAVTITTEFEPRYYD